MRRNLNTVLILLFTAMASTQAMSATFVLSVADGAGEGFNDPNPPAHANQIGNNPGATLGQLRTNLFNAAAMVWGDLLDSNITITISAQFDPLACMPNSGVLGSASNTGSHVNFGAGSPNVAYHVALAESLADSNLNGGTAEISAMFNSAIDANDPNCLGGGGFYYGLDDNAPTGTTPLFPVVLHELAHGLGFAALVNVGPGGTGAFIGSGGFPDTFSRNLMDQETGKAWDAMNNAERLASATNDPDLVWKGAQVTADRPMFLDPAPELEINAPPGIAGVYEANLGAEPDIVIPGGGVTADMIDGDAAVGDPCVDVPGGAAGKIVLYDLPAGCIGAVPAFLAEFGGAVGAIIANTAATGLPDISAQISNQDVTIPYIGATMTVGAALRANIGTANVTIRESASVLNGDNAGKLRMFAPAVFVQGSSVSHWTSEARPDLLMESVRGALEYNQVDITPSAFVDIGWFLLDGSVLFFEDGFED